MGEPKLGRTVPLTGTTVSTGEREIEPVEAAVVEGIFRQFVAGRSPKQIAKRLNQQGVAGPFGGKWSPSTIYGNGKRGTGVLNNELYIGQLVWNRLRYLKNPDKLLNLMLDDEIAVDEGKTEIKTLDARRKDLQAHLESADEPPPLRTLKWPTCTARR